MKNLFKNFKTKKQLREEIAFLKGQLSVPTPVLRVERDAIKIAGKVDFEKDVPADYLKREVVRKICNQIEQFCEWDMVETEHGNSLIGYLYIMSRG